MKITYDPEADAAYLYFKDSIGDGEVTKTECCLENSGSSALINADVNSQGMLLGIEILGASECLPQEFLARAELLD